MGYGALVALPLPWGFLTISMGLSLVLSILHLVNLIFLGCFSTDALDWPVMWRFMACFLGTSLVLPSVIAWCVLAISSALAFFLLGLVLFDWVYLWTYELLGSGSFRG